MKQLVTLIVLPIIGLALAACGSGDGVLVDSIPTAETVAVVDEVDNSADAATITPVPVVVEYDADDLETSISDAEITAVRLNGNTAAISGDGATVEGSIVTITSAGAYDISGTLDDGRLSVDTQDKETLMLILNGVDIASSSSAPITINSADKAMIVLAERTENRVSDGKVYVYDDSVEEKPNAAIFGKDDLTINVSGSLIVEGNFNHGIAGKDDLKITGGNISVTAVNDGIKGRDSIAVRDGILTIDAGGDGLHAEATLTINGGELTITRSYEGLEGKDIVINEGLIRLESSDDGINGSTGAGDQAMGGRPGPGQAVPGQFMAGDSQLTINGGYIAVDTRGDGLDINGAITMTGGLVLVNGPVENNDGPVDYTGSFDIRGGFVVAAVTVAGSANAGFFGGGPGRPGGTRRQRP